MPSGGESAFCTRSAKRRQKDAAGRLTFPPSCATIHILCRCGGTSRRKGLKIPRWKHRTGSIPVSGIWPYIQRSFAEYRAFFVLISVYQKQSLVNFILAIPSIFSAKNPSILLTIPRFCGIISVSKGRCSEVLQ